MEWTHEEITSLHEMLQRNEHMTDIVRKLGRTKNAIMHVVKKMVLQQLLYHDPSEVAANYNMSVHQLRNEIVDPKFYVPIRSQVIPKSFYMMLLVLLTAGVTRFGMVLSQNRWLQY